MGAVPALLRTGWTLLALGLAVAALLPPPLAAQPRVDIRNASVTEPDAGPVQASLEVRLTAPSTDPVSVTYQPLTEGTPPPTIAAGCGGEADVVGPTGTVEFAPGDVSESVPVTVCGDPTDEPDEILRVRLMTVAGAVFGERTGRLTIVDNDEPAALPTVSIDDLTVPEGPGASTANLTVRLSAPSTQPVTVVATLGAGGTATAATSCVPGSDAAFAPRPVTINPGQPSATTPVGLCGDTTPEPDEAFSVTLVSPVNATLGDAIAAVTIQNDDLVPLRVSVRDTTVAEGDLGSRTVEVTLTLTRASTERVTVNYTGVSGGSALPGTCGSGGADVQLPSGSVRFDPGDVVESFPVTVCGDLAIESSESLLLRLTGATVATLANDRAVLTIQDDEAARAVVGRDDDIIAAVEPARPDLDVDVLGAQFLTQAAPNLAFHTTLENTGAFQASNVLLRLTLPEDVSFVRVENNQVGPCRQNGTDASGAVRVDCTAASLPTGAERGVQVIGRTVGSVPDSTQYVFAASVDPDNTIAETDERNNTSFLSVTVRAPADLAIISGGSAIPGGGGIIASPALVPSCAPNEIINVGLTVRNRGPNRSAPTVIAAEWPTGVAGVGPFSGGPPNPCFERCAVPALNSGQTTRIDLFARSVEQVLLLRARFRVEAPALDPVASNNSLTVTLCDNR